MVALADIRPCLEGAIPSVIATCDAEGVPNVSYVSQVHYVDERHVALTFQFFNKTHRNIAANPHATIILIDPETAAQYRVALLYRHTETVGPLFASLKAKLAGIAAHTGMSDLFRLKGADVYRVLDIECISAGNSVLRTSVPSLLPGLRSITAGINNSKDISRLLDVTIDGLKRYFHIEQVMILLADETGSVLYTLASSGYATSGIGAETLLGCGIIGISAQEKLPVRIAFGAMEYCYGDAIRAYSAEAGVASLETNIPFPGLDKPESQLAIPLLCGERLIGVLYVESGQSRRFGYDDEDVLAVIGDLFANRYALLAQGNIVADSPSSVTQAAIVQGTPLPVRYFPGNHSIFLNQDYLIKGVAGAILWRLLQYHQQEGRSEFTNKELRLDPSLGLPELSENLETRLILLQRRLSERSEVIAIEKTGRGRFRLRLTRPVRLCIEQ